MFQAEVNAVSLALICLRNTVGLNVAFFIDSQAAILALRSHTTHSKIINECKAKLSEFSKSNTCSIIWVPGHHGVPGNEQADLIANTAAVQDWVGREPSLPVSMCIVKKELKVNAEVEIDNQWSNKEQCSHTKQIIRDFNISFKTNIINYRRHEIAAILAIITGHGNFKAHLADEPNCPKCEQESDTSIHFLTQCPYYKEARLRTFGLSVLKGAAKPDCMNVSLLLQFISLSQRFSQ